MPIKVGPWARQTTEELVDSGSLLGDWAAMRERIASTGYVFVRGLLSADMVVLPEGQGCDTCNGLAGLHRAMIRSRPGRSFQCAAVRMRDAFGDPGYRRIVTDPAYNAIPFTSPPADLMAQMLGPQGFCYPSRSPEWCIRSAWCLDKPETSFTRTTAPCRTCSPAGCPWATCRARLVAWQLPGSQHSDTVRNRPLTRLERGWASTDYEAGDVLVFHCLTTHAALPNREQRMRFSAEFRGSSRINLHRGAW